MPHGDDGPAPDGNVLRRPSAARRALPRVVVFDFDGTLVLSNQLKYDAYFELFPKDARHRRAIEKVLAVQYEDSRFVILDAIVRAVEQRPSPPPARRESVNRLADLYGRAVTDGAKTCPERPGAGPLLQELSTAIPIYLASTTPEDSLRDILVHRGWLPLFRAVYGYPTRKSDALLDIARREQTRPSELLLVGDGESDRQAADQVGCRFLPVNERTSAREIAEAIHAEGTDV